MTFEEAQSWVRYHAARFPSFSAWVKKNVSESPEAKEYWKATLGCHELEEAKHITDQMNADPQAPKFPADQFRAIVQSLKRVAERHIVRRDGPRKLKCSLCKDRLLVMAKWKQPPDQLVKRLGSGATIYKFLFACDCEAGAAMATRTGMAAIERGRMEIFG